MPDIALVVLLILVGLGIVITIAAGLALFVLGGDK